MSAPQDLPDSWRTLRAEDVPADAIPQALAVLGGLRDELVARRVAALVSRNGAPAEEPRRAGEDRLLTVPQVAERLQVTERWVRDHKRELGGFGTRKTLRFPESRIRRWAERNRR